MTRRSFRVTVAAVLAFLGTHTAAADDLANQSFKIVYDAQGIRSLKRTNDVHDTDYIQANGSLGRLLIRYRTTPTDRGRRSDARAVRARESRRRAHATGLSVAGLAGATTSCPSRAVVSAPLKMAARPWFRFR
jgi:hypothetical protein